LIALYKKGVKEVIQTNLQKELKFNICWKSWRLSLSFSSVSLGAALRCKLSRITRRNKQSDSKIIANITLLRGLAIISKQASNMSGFRNLNSG
jgi:hypothetical protein